MRFMGDATNPSNPYNIPGLPGYDPTKPIVIVPPGTPPVAPGGNPVPGTIPALPSTGSPMDPTLKAQFIAAVPSLSAAQQQDLYDIGAATPQAATARYMYLAGGAAVGIAIGWVVRGMRKKR